MSPINCELCLKISPVNNGLQINSTIFGFARKQMRSSQKKSAKQTTTTELAGVGFCQMFTTAAALFLEGLLPTPSPHTHTHAAFSEKFLFEESHVSYTLGQQTNKQNNPTCPQEQHRLKSMMDHLKKTKQSPIVTHVSDHL